ncbi:mucosa-associated lymphoid tissue lymphoma translocation protein 1 homolog isoform X3 [Paramormyrops kingsleyae]
MGDWSLGLGTLGEEALRKLAAMLDNPKCGWRQLAAALTEKPQFRYSEKQLIGCSLQVLSSTGSPSRSLLAMLADHACPLGFLLHCLKKIEHHSAVQYLSVTVMEQIRITVQPESQFVQEGKSVILKCRAAGPTGLTYQWFKGKAEVPGGSGPELVLCPFAAALQGHYICRVSQAEHFVFSQWARVSSCSASMGIICNFSSVRDLCIIGQPQSVAASEGESLHLECTVEGNPAPEYQWYHNKDPLPQAVDSHLKIPCVTTADRGQYSCRVYNRYQEVWSDEVYVSVGPCSFSESCWAENVQGSSACPVRQRRHFYATDKVALLIGNMNYQHHRQLKAPMADVHELTNLLRQLDFKVVSLLDLSWQEMHSAVTEFLLLLDRGVYGLLYFAGHGYENYGNSFMVPIDAPASYTSEHCLWVQDVLQRMQERQTGLNVFLLDMCRKRNLNDDVIPQPGPLKVTANIVFGYATCVDAEAYEMNKDDLSNGIFMSFLKRRLLEDEKVTVMLDKVAEDMGRCDITRGRQALELRSNLSERRALTDRVQASSCPAATSARNLQWAIAHVLPESRCLQFDCGVRVQLGFAAEFSNIMVVYSRILRRPSHVVACTAQLSDFSEGVDVDLKLTNRESPRDAGSWLLAADNSAELSLYTRFTALQKVKKELSFTVCLQYQYDSMDEQVQERLTVSVGKPLVAKLNLSEACLPCHASTASSFDSQIFGPAGSGCSPEPLHCCPPSAYSQGPASACWAPHVKPVNCADAACPGSANMPEETFSPEFELLQTQALQAPSAACKSVQPSGSHLEDLPIQSGKQNFHSF